MEQSGNQIDVPNGENKLKAEPNVWIVTLPWYSHMLCHLNLAKHMARYGLTVTFFLPDEDIERLAASGVLAQESWKREGLDIRLHGLTVATINLGHGEGIAESARRSFTSMTEIEGDFELTLKTSLDSHVVPTCIISDMWLPGVKEAGIRNNIPAWTMVTFAATYIASSYYLHHLNLAGILKFPTSQSDPEFENEVFILPGLSTFSFKDFLGGWIKGSFTFESSRRGAIGVEKSDVVLLSGFQELEERSFRAFKNLLKAASVRNRTKEPHVWTVGPTFPFLSHTGESGKEEKLPVIRFLDSQPKSSVLYVAFGGDVNHSREQILEIAHGLENSQQPFLCFMRPQKSPDGLVDIFSIIPPDLVKRTKNRGLFSQGWSDQMKILAHPSTGGFLSHCGFNSILEGICMGVPLLGWPSRGDQPFNCRWLADEEDLVIEICRSPDGFADRGQVEEGVRALFHTERGKAIRKRTLELKELAKQAVGENGSTRKHLNALVELIRSL